MAQKIQIGDQWYVSAPLARAEESPQVLKDNDTFAMFDRFGDAQVLVPGEQGIYHEDTRYLSFYELLIDDLRPLYLGSTVKDDSSLLVIDLMNPDLPRGDGSRIEKGTIHIFRSKVLWEACCHEHIRLTNHGGDPLTVKLAVAFAADFVDLFEVRGMQREQRGQRLAGRVTDDQVTLSYLGLDNERLDTRLRFSPPPSSLSENVATFEVVLEPRSVRHLYCTVSCIRNDPATVPRVRSYEEALNASAASRRIADLHCCAVESSNLLFNRWVDRSRSDLAMLTTSLPSGPYPYAGVPWYSTTFGRDGILTAHQYLWLDPSMARGVLSFLSATQAVAENPQSDAEPGKILHEARKSEMARTREIPFGRYYGTVDATPLFVGLAGAYYRRTGDLGFIREIWPNIVAALAWIDRYGDDDGDGFVEYARRSSDGLVQQGWKDSQDSIFHADGRLAEPPIALCEVQAYVYDAKLQAGMLAGLLGDTDLSQRLREDAALLKQRFRDAFWCEELGTYAIALDGGKQQCRVAASNAGHALWTGIASQKHAARIVSRMMGQDLFCGWGIRTVGSGQARYNPMSYHNGSVWPHDNALVAAGMARYGHVNEALRVMAALYDASLSFEQHRLPELFCGFPRRDAEGPTLYPVACSPQAWAAAAVFGLLQACLGIRFEPDVPEIVLHRPRLPDYIRWLKIGPLSIGQRSVELLLRRYENNVGIDVTHKHGHIDITLAV
jgi:glycogen debranching enzyme